MGVVAADADGDGDEDLLLTHLTLESNTFYRADGRGGFEDRSVPSGLGSPSWEWTGFGNAWIDVDNDGWLDLLTVNGGVKIIPEQMAAGDPLPLRMPRQLYRNLGVGEDGDVSFEEVPSTRAGDSFEELDVGRGLALGDIDNDGDSDALISNNAGPLRLLINRHGQEQHWLGLRLVGSVPGRRESSSTSDETSRDMLGAWVALETKDRTLWRRLRTGGSYASANASRLLFGLGASPSVGALTIWWPDGYQERFEVEGVDRYLTVRRGDGEELGDD